jgi:hypothetical protein
VNSRESSVDQEADVGAVVLVCGPAVVGARPGVARVAVPARPAKADLDPVLADDPERVIVAGTDADLAAVVLRLLRAERLDIAVGFVPHRRTRASRLWGLPADPLELALHGEPSAFPLVRDDSGGVLVGRGSLGPVNGEAYCDDQLALRGRAKRIEVMPDPAGGVTGRVVRFGRRTREFHGRAFQTGCHPTTVIHDGITHPRPVPRWTWYRHPVDLRAVR